MGFCVGTHGMDAAKAGVIQTRVKEHFTFLQSRVDQGGAATPPYQLKVGQSCRFALTSAPTSGARLAHPRTRT